MLQVRKSAPSCASMAMRRGPYEADNPGFLGVSERVEEKHLEPPFFRSQETRKVGKRRSKEEASGAVLFESQWTRKRGEVNRSW